MQTYLKIKIKSLSSEAHIIRFEERKVKAQRAHARAHQKDDTILEATFQGLQRHRKRDVRGEARVAQIAYGFLRRKPYAAVEHPGSSPFDKRRVQSLLCRYGSLSPKEAEERLAEWLKAA